jgi:uncharacterized protein YukE
MKHLEDFINESIIVENEESKKTITFDFTDLENAEETIDSLKEKDGVSVDDKKVTVEVTSDNVDKLGSIQDILQQFAETIRGSQKRSSDEQYAQKTKSFAEKVNELNDAIDEIKNPKDEDE